MTLEVKRKFYYASSLVLFGLFLTQAYQLIRHLQILPQVPNGFEVHTLEIVTQHEGERFVLQIKDDFRKEKISYPVTWFNPISKIFFDSETTPRTFLSISFLKINFTYPGLLLIFNFIEILFTSLIFFYCLFNRRHYTSSFFDHESTLTQITRMIAKDLTAVTSPSIRVAASRNAERWYLFRGEQKLGPYTLMQVEYLADEKTSIREYLCMSTYDHQVYKVKNIIGYND